MAASTFGDIKENSMHQPMLSGVTVWAGVSSQYRIALHLVNGTVTSQYYLNNIINPVIVPLHEQQRPDFIFMGDNTPAYQGQIIMERLLEAGVPHMEWPALPWDQLSRRVEGRNPAPQNLIDLRAALQEEGNAMPQQTTRWLVYSMKRRCQAVIDAQGHLTSYWDIYFFCCDIPTTVDSFCFNKKFEIEITIGRLYLNALLSWYNITVAWTFYIYINLTRKSNIPKCVWVVCMHTHTYIYIGLSCALSLEEASFWDNNHADHIYIYIYIYTLSHKS